MSVKAANMPTPPCDKHQPRHTLKPEADTPVGEVRKATKGQRSVYAEIGLWAEKHGDWIQIHISGPSRTTVTNNPNSERFHRTLFRDLRRTLLKENCWPYGEAGVETENQVSPMDRFDPIPVLGDRTASEIIIAERG